MELICKRMNDRFGSTELEAKRESEWDSNEMHTHILVRTDLGNESRLPVYMFCRVL